MKLSTFAYYLLVFLIGLESPYYLMPNFIIGIICLITLIIFKIKADLKQ